MPSTLPQPRPAFPPRLGAEQPAPADWRVDDDDLVSELVLDGVDVAGADLSLVDVQGCRISGARLAGSRWYRGGWRDVEVADSDLSTATFPDSGWTRVAVRACRLTGIGLAGDVLEDVDVSGSAAGLANLRQARLRRAAFRSTSMVEADFGAARLEDVLFEDCDLGGAQFSSARMTRVTFRRCRLDGLQGVAGLAGAVVEPLDVTDLTLQLAAALRITVSLP